MSRRFCAIAGADVLVSYLPVGSEEATKFYVEQALEAGCGFINCVPVFIASNPEWAARFEAKKAADYRRRYQIAGRRDHHASRFDQLVFRERGVKFGADVSAQLWRQHRFHEYAGARAFGIEEN